VRKNSSIAVNLGFGAIGCDSHDCWHNQAKRHSHHQRRQGVCHSLVEGNLVFVVPSYEEAAPQNLEESDRLYRAEYCVKLTRSAYARILPSRLDRARRGCPRLTAIIATFKKSQDDHTIIGRGILRSAQPHCPKWAS
jgi:hypothetical protein